MKIMITGGAGFIGSHLTDRLLDDGYEVSVIDNLSTGALKNVAHHQGNRRFHLTVDTILNRRVMDGLISRCDAIVHLAAGVGVKLIMEKPVETLETNVLGTEIVLNLADQYHKKVILASTSEIYGKSVNEHQEPSFSEGTESVIGPTTKRRWAYACSKALDEFLALAYFEEKGLPVIIVRLFNTVGPRQTGAYGMVLPNFVQKALAGEPMIVHGDGSQSRSFIHVSDTVGALIRLLQEKGAVGHVFNVGNPCEISINELARLVKKLCASPSRIEHVPYESVYGPGFEDMQKRCPDISKLKSLIGFELRCSLEDIIHDVIDYYRTCNG
jgi:UDP-glucose 4-epimerase